MSKVVADLSVVTSVGLDLAKHVFQVHAVDGTGRVIVAKALRRRDLLSFFASRPRCLIVSAKTSPHFADRLCRYACSAEPRCSSTIRTRSAFNLPLAAGSASSRICSIQ